MPDSNDNVSVPHNGQSAHSAVAVSNIRREFGQLVALENLSFAADQGEFVSFLGPSGCGKTTLLRIIAGLEKPTSGSVHIHGEPVTDYPPYQRQIGMVFQNYALFPHKDVANNIAFGLRHRLRKPRAERLELIRNVLQLVQLTEHEDRKPSQLSGGQQQRIALARALVTEPKVLLLDEPLSNLDAKLRAEMRTELKQIHEKVGITFIYVTHDRQEALAMSDRVVLMNNGRIEQLGSPQEVYERPKSEYVARFLSNANLIDGVVRKCYEGRSEITLSSGETYFHTACEDLRKNETVQLVIRPECMDVRPTGAEFLETELALQGVVERVLYQGSIIDVSIRLNDGQTVKAEVQNHYREPVATGEEVFAVVRRELISLLPKPNTLESALDDN